MSIGEVDYMGRAVHILHPAPITEAGVEGRWNESSVLQVYRIAAVGFPGVSRGYIPFRDYRKTGTYRKFGAFDRDKALSGNAAGDGNFAVHRLQHSKGIAGEGFDEVDAAPVERT